VSSPITLSEQNRRELIGLIPAAGRATRISPLPCSKEVLPIGFQGDDSHARPKVVSHYLLEKMRFAGISKAYFVLRAGKWDIPAYFGNGSVLDFDLAYLVLENSFGVPFTLDQAYPFVRDAIVAFGFPDILFEPEDAFTKLLHRHLERDSDVTLGLFPTNGPFSKEDRVEFDSAGDVRELILRPLESHLRYSWAIAVWNPGFTRFLHEYTAEKKAIAEEMPELSAGHAIQAAIEGGLRVAGLIIAEVPYLDIGTPAGLKRALQQTA
jgi:glucose-1-phosphate thymidylyltransferase